MLQLERSGAGHMHVQDAAMAMARRRLSLTGWQRAANAAPTIEGQSVSTRASARPRRREAGSSSRVEQVRQAPQAAAAARGLSLLGGAVRVGPSGALRARTRT